MPVTIPVYTTGTFVPTVFIGATQVTSYTTQVGQFTQFGALICFYIEVNVSNRGAGVGDITVQSLPFTVSVAYPTLTQCSAICAIEAGFALTAPYRILVGEFNPGTATATLWKPGISDTTPTISNSAKLTKAEFPNGSAFKMSGSYLIDI